MMRNTWMCAAVAATITATGASASDQHTVLILPDAFFPEVTYVKPGDKVVFVNLQPGDTSVVGKGESWSVGPLSLEGEDHLEVSGGMETVFYDADKKDEEGNYSLKGSLSFQPAPLN